MKLDMKLMAYINTFEALTRAHVKDVFEEDNSVVFVVKQGDIGKAVGKKGFNIRKMESVFKKKVRLIEFNNDPCKFLLNLLYPLKVDIKLVDDKVVIKTEDVKMKGRVFGRDRSNLKRISLVFKKYYPYEIGVE